jgi:hypothetical protein
MGAAITESMAGNNEKFALLGAAAGELIVAGLNGSVKVENCVITAIPFAAFHANALFSPKKNLFPNFIHIATLIYIIIINIKILRGW